MQNHLLTLLLAASSLPMIHAHLLWINWKTLCQGESYAIKQTAMSSRCQYVPPNAAGKQPISITIFADPGYVCDTYAYADASCQIRIMSALDGEVCAGDKEFRSYRSNCWLV